MTHFHLSLLEGASSCLNNELSKHVSSDHVQKWLAMKYFSEWNKSSTPKVFLNMARWLYDFAQLVKLKFLNCFKTKSLLSSFNKTWKYYDILLNEDGNIPNRNHSTKKYNFILIFSVNNQHMEVIWMKHSG